ncbi:MAG: 2-phospho-L-lactate guanylyltransferase [Terracoccus sp.]
MTDLSTPPSATPFAEAPGESAWHVVIPVKETRYGKSRLARATGTDRAVLSRAVADDTIAAAAQAVGTALVVVVTSDAALVDELARLGVDVVADPGGGLNPAIEAGLHRVKETSRGSRPAVLLGDLPCLTAADVRAALAAARPHDQSFVPDCDGIGTVLRCGGAASGLRPRFGSASAARHAADGAARLDLDLPRLRTDVDDPASLVAAIGLGLGPRTARVVDRLGSGWIRDMQASVHTFDPEHHTGSVLLDDGRRVAFTAVAFESSGLRLVRLGQRLTVEVAGDVIISLGIVGIGPDQPIH